MKTIFLLTNPKEGNQAMIDGIMSLRNKLNDEGYAVIELHDVYEHVELDTPIAYPSRGELFAEAVRLLIDKANEVWLGPNWHDSEDCIALLDVAKHFGKPAQSSFPSNNANFIILRVGLDLCPKSNKPVVMDICNLCRSRHVTTSVDGKRVFCKTIAQ